MRSEGDQGSVAVRWFGVDGCRGEMRSPIDWSAVAHVELVLPGVSGVTVEIEFSPAPMMVHVSGLHLLGEKGDQLSDQSDACPGMAAVAVGDNLAILRSGSSLVLGVHEASAPAHKLCLELKRVGSVGSPALAEAIQRAFEERDEELQRFTTGVDEVLKDLTHRVGADYSYDEAIAAKNSEIERLSAECTELRSSLDALNKTVFWRAYRKVGGALAYVKKRLT